MQNVKKKLDLSHSIGPFSFTVWLYRVTLTPAAIGIINIAALCAHVQYHLHLSPHDTKSIPLKTCLAVQNELTVRSHGEALFMCVFLPG